MSVSPATSSRHINYNVEYNPLPSQYDFHAMPGMLRLAAGGVRSGKTFAGAVEFLQLCIENPGCDVAIVAPFYQTLHGVSLREFRKLIEAIPGMIRGESAQFGYIDLANGTRVWYRSAENPTSYEGLTLAAFWADEARYYKPQAWNVLLSRLSCPKAQHLCGIITTTPSMGFLYEEFCTGKKYRHMCRFNTLKNHHLTSMYTDGLAESYSPTLYKQYVMGEFVHLTGGVFPEFSVKKHFGEDLYDPTLPVDAGVDYGINNPAVVYTQKHSYCRRHKAKDCVHVIDEWMPQQISTELMAPKIAAKYDKEGWHRGTLYVDKAGRGRDQHSGMDGVYLLRRADEKGFTVKYATSPRVCHIPNGIARITSKLEPAKGRPSLYIEQRLEKTKGKGVVQALLHSRYPTKDEVVTSDKPLKNDGLDHARDALRYYIINTCERHERKPGTAF